MLTGKSLLDGILDGSSANVIQSCHTVWRGLRGIAFGIFLTSELARKLDFVCLRRLPVSIWPYIALKIAAFGGVDMADDP